MEHGQETTPPATLSNDSASGSPTRTAAKRKRNDGADETPQLARRAIPDASEYPRKRVSIACDVCRVRKTRCDAAKPACSFCIEIGAQCTYRKPSLGDRATRKENGNPITKIMERLDRMESLLLDSGKSAGGEDHVRDPVRDLIPDVVWQFPEPPLQASSNLGPSPPSTSSVRGDAPFVPVTTDGLSRSDTHLLTLPSLETWLCSSPFNAIFYDESERYIATELQQGANFYSCSVSEELDISPKTCWRLQRSFAKNVLPWIPLFDQEYCVEKVANASNSGFAFENASAAMVMFILALGALTNDDDNTKDSPETFAGLGYFLKGCKIVGQCRAEANSLTMIQCQILWAMYLVHCLRPLQAWNLVIETMRDTIILCQLKTRIQGDVRFREMAKRAYWACYVMDYELRGQLVLPPREPHKIHESMQLPSSDLDEPGIFYFLSEIALRQLFENVNEHIGFRAGYTRYAPVITFELRSQLTQWYSNLPPSLRFPLGRVPILDPQKAFLRAQYYSVIVITGWPFIVRFVAQHPDFRGEEELLVQQGRECLESCTLYIDTLESIMHCRNLMIFPNILGLQCQLLMLLVTLRVPILHEMQHPGAEAAIRKGLAILKIWEDNPSIHIVVERFEGVMARMGISQDQNPAQSSPHSQQGIESFATSTPSDQVNKFSSAQLFGEGWNHYGETTTGI